jgi:membrane-associated phospholipid phosphatase
VRQDHVFLATWGARALVESFGKLIPFYLELCYFLVYGLPAYCIAVLYACRKRWAVDRFVLIYLTGTLAAYALFPYFPTQPPRLVFPGVDNPSFVTWVRHLNLYILGKATIHVGVFPSAHVSSAFSAAWAMFLLLPGRKVFSVALLAYAISVSLATIYGRYHYSADVVSGFVVSLLAALVCLILQGGTAPRQP